MPPNRSGRAARSCWCAVSTSALALVERGARIPVLTLGGLHYAAGKDKVSDYVYLDAADRRAARALLARGVRSRCRTCPLRARSRSKPSIPRCEPPERSRPAWRPSRCR